MFNDLQPTDRLYCVQENMNLFWTFIFLRHQVWYRRFIERSPKPWTLDPVISQFRFTNVYRELDKGTLFLLDEVAPEGMDVMNTVFRIMVYRTFNHIPTWSTLDATGIEMTWENWKLEWAIHVVRFLKAEGERVFTNAHIVSPYTSMPGDTKAEKVCHFLDTLHTHMASIVENLQAQPSLEKAFKYVQSLYGFGPFLAYELVVDFMYRGVLKFTEDDWANAGPGAMRGGNLIYPNRKDYLSIMVELRDSQRSHFDRLHLPFFEIAYTGRSEDGHLTLRNIEHCLCEFQKYHRGFHGTGRPRNEFHSTSAGDTAWEKRLAG